MVFIEAFRFSYLIVVLVRTVFYYLLFSTELCVMRNISRFLFLFFLFQGAKLPAQCISSYPFSEDFEQNAGNWTPGGTNSDWSWGSPVKIDINTAGSGINCWISGGLVASTYGGSQKSWIESPCFDFTSLQRPYLTFLIYWDTERQYDGGNLQYSLNNGNTWANLGSTSQVQDCLEKNWYNASNITNLSGLANPQQGWSGTLQGTSGSCLGGNGSGGWKEAGICMSFLAGEPNVQFRFTFASGSTCNSYDGIAIDLFTIQEAPVPQVNATFSCDGDYSVSFTGNSTLCPQQWKWFFGDPTTLADSATGQNATYTFPGPGSYSVTMEAFHSCTVKGSAATIIKFPSLDVTTDSVNCEGGSDGAAQATVSGVNSPVFTWGTDPVAQTATVNGLSAGNYTLSIGSADGCTLDTLVEIVYGSDATVAADLGPDRFICPGESILLYPGSYSDYLWQDGSTDSVFLALQADEYSVTVSNTSGCTAVAAMEVIYSCGDNVWIPSAFSPGSDGLNDYFKPEATVFEEGKLWIFNRWGQPVFTGDFLIGWDGMLNGQPSPEGIYYYRFRYRLPGDKYREKAGWLTLLR